MEKKSRKFSHLTEVNRFKIERMIRDGYSSREIADALHVHVSTINREKKRGACVQRDTELREREVYCADVAQRKYEENLRAKGPELKIGRNIELANYLENLIVDEKYSPDAALAKAKEEGVTGDLSICRVTLYSYIDKGIFLRLTNKALPIKGERKSKTKKVVRLNRAPRGDSIEERPEEVAARAEFGHWEMDSVLGKQSNKKRLLVLTERKTRHEIIVLLENGKTETVVAAINALERKFGQLRFRRIFQSITVDNGVEFADYEGIQASCIEAEEERTHLYYCHPYSSSERGSNENANKLIRRWLPKGTDFTDLNDKQIRRIEEWMNNYPRRKLSYNTARDRYIKELGALGIAYEDVA